jgi:hypothetical protein
MTIIRLYRYFRRSGFTRLLSLRLAWSRRG